MTGLGALMEELAKAYQTERAERTAKAKGRTISIPELQRWTVANGFAWPDELTPA